MTLSEEDCNIFILRKLVHVLLVIKTFENITECNASVELHLTTQEFFILFRKISLMQDIYALGIDVHYSKYTWLPILFRHNDVMAHLITK